MTLNNIFIILTNRFVIILSMMTMRHAILIVPSILTLLALTIFATFEPSLIALTILFRAIRLLTIASLQMLIGLNLFTERIRIPIHKYKYSIIPLISIIVQIMATHTITALTSLIDPKTITIEFKTFCLFTIANYFFTRIFLWQHFGLWRTLGNTLFLDV